ncbi:carboxypeptidase regulatory-like domain-containing protein [Acidobacteria bacterium AB60]|nr:carboxypeptidase regulatory-like domain-containing protein [Acidobacteria bacterium AB60]
MTSPWCSTLTVTHQNQPRSTLPGRNHLIVKLVLLALFVSGLCLSASAQQATVVGTITDPSGAAVPNVTVTVTNLESGVARTVQTNDAGQYVAPDLNIGHYSLKAQANGFKAVEQKNVNLQVGDRARIDFQMQVGEVQETVTVESDAVRVQTDSGEQSSVITGQQISQIAVSGRSMYQLAALVPGASSQIGAGGMSAGEVNTPVGGDASVEFNGLRQNHNIYLLDGGEDDDRGGAGGMSIAPSSDAIAEFRTLTSNYSADYGLSSAGTMSMVLKSGTRNFHASAWEFNRNDAFDARNYFNPAPQKVAELRLNVFGFNAGGPVTLGPLYNQERKRTFFFYNQEWRRLIQGGLTNQPVPDRSTYGGDFGSQTIKVPSASAIASNVLARNCPGGVLPVGVVQGQPFPNNTIPSCMISPNSNSLLTAGIFPAANAVSGGKPTFIGGNNSPTNLTEEVVRIDHSFSSKLAVFGHFISEQVTQGFGVSQWSGANLPTVGDTFGNPSYSAVVHATYTINPSLLNETAFNYNGNRINIVPFAGSGLKSLALPAGYDSSHSRLFSGPNNLGRIPNIDLNGSLGSHFEISSWPWHNKADDYQLRDDLSWTKGVHQLKFGVSWALYKKVQDLFGQTQGSFNFDGTYTGSDFADFLLGAAKGYTELAVQDKGFWNNVSWATYVQDNWRVNHNLTLNLGVRWDGVPHTYEANDRMGNFYPSLYKAADAAILLPDGTISPSSPGLGTSPNPILKGVPLYLNGIGIPEKDGVPKGLVHNNWATVGPRLGFAYDVAGNAKTVIRGGFGIMYERIQGNDMYNAGPNIPFSLNVNNSSVEIENPSILLATGTAAAKPINPASITGLAINQYKQPASYQYSAGIQHQLNSQSVLSLAYVGNQNRFQNDYRQANLPDESYLPQLIAGAQYNTAPGLPYRGFQSINLSTNEANSHYNGFQVDLNSHIHSLNLRAYYTLSRTVDPTLGGGGGADLSNVSNPYLGWKYDKGPGGYDRTHNGAVNFIYDIPFLQKSSNRLLKTALGSWEVSGIVTMTSGLPINPQLTGGQSSNGLPNATNRPDKVSNVTYPHKANQWFNTAAFAAPAVGTWGNAGFNSLRGPGRDNWNLSLFKSFPLNEDQTRRFEFRAESFNVWNHTQFNAVSNGLGASNFGQVTSAFDPRVFQFGGKFYF